MSDGRPLGIVVSGILAALVGLFSLLAGLAIMGIAGVIGATGSTVMGAFVLVLGILEFTSAYGLFTGEEWAWQLTVAVFGIETLRNVYGIVSSGSINALSVIVLLIVAGIAGYVYTQKDYFDVSGGLAA